VADFGLARVYGDENDSKITAMTEYVTTRWYVPRAPSVWPPNVGPYLDPLCALLIPQVPRPGGAGGLVPLHVGGRHVGRGLHRRR
jgi:hypothetical protein